MKRIIMPLLAILWLQGCSGEKSAAKKLLFKENWGTETTVGSKIGDLDVTSYYSNEDSTFLSFNASKVNMGYHFEANKSIKQLKAGASGFWEPKTSDSKELYKEITGDDFLGRVFTLDDSWISGSKNELNIINADKVAINKKIQSQGKDAMIVIGWDLAGTTVMTIPGRSPEDYSEVFCYLNAEARDDKLWIEEVNCEAHISKEQLPALKEAFAKFTREFHGGTSSRLEKQLFQFLDESFSASDESNKRKIEIESQPYVKWEITREKSKFYKSSNGDKILDFGFSLYKD